VNIGGSIAPIIIGCRVSSTEFISDFKEFEWLYEDYEDWRFDSFHTRCYESAVSDVTQLLNSIDQGGPPVRRGIVAAGL
jgi:hypothetical protein